MQYEEALRHWGKEKLNHTYVQDTKFQWVTIPRDIDVNTVVVDLELDPGWQSDDSFAESPSFNVHIKGFDRLSNTTVRVSFNFEHSYSMDSILKEILEISPDNTLTLE